MTGRGRPSLGERATFSVRLHPRVLEAVKASAEQDLRSINTQIEALLTEALQARGHLRTGRRTDKSDPA